MFSDRVSGSRSSNPVLLALEARRASGAPILDLTESNPTRVALRYEGELITRALADPANLLYEPDPRGMERAREAVCAYYRDRGLEVDPASLILTSGTSEAYGYLFRLLARPGDEALVPKPGYPLLEVLTALEAVRLVHYPLRYHDEGGWRVELERLGDSVSTRTVAIVAVSPNNPTGSYLKRDELEEMSEIATRHGLALVVDEVFSDYAASDDPARLASVVGNRRALTFVLNGLSKTAGLPQLKLSWIHVSGPDELRREALERLEFIADAYLSVSSTVQNAARALLETGAGLRAQIQERLRRNEDFLAGALEASPLRLLLREGGWYAVMERPDSPGAEGADDDEIVVSLIEREGVLLHPGYFYDFPRQGFLVASLLTEPAVFREGISRLIASTALRR